MQFLGLRYFRIGLVVEIVLSKRYSDEGFKGIVGERFLCRSRAEPDAEDKGGRKW